MRRIWSVLAAHKAVVTVVTITVVAGSGIAAGLATGASRQRSDTAAGAPSNASLQVANGSVTVSWASPGAPVPVTGFDVTLVPTNNDRVPQPSVGANGGVLTKTVDANIHSVTFTGLIEDCHQRYELVVATRTAHGLAGAVTTASFRPSGIVVPGAAPPYVVVLVDGIDSQQPGFTMDPYKPTLDHTPSYCPESWNAATRSESEADFAGAPNGPWSFFHKWSHGETDENGNPVPGPLLTASEPKALSGNGSASTDTHAFMLDAIAATGAVILPFSYHNHTGLLHGFNNPAATLTKPAGAVDPTFTFPAYSQADSDPLKAGGSITLYGQLLQTEVQSIQSVWPTTKIVIMGHSQGGLVALTAWEQSYQRYQWTVFTLDSPINGVCPTFGCAGPPGYPDYNKRGTYDEGNNDTGLGYLVTDASTNQNLRFIGTYGDSPAISLLHLPPLRAYGTGPETLEHQMPFDYVAHTSDQIEAACTITTGGPSGWQVSSSCPAPAPPDHISECPVDYNNVPQWITDTGHFVVKYCPGDVAYFNQVLGLQYFPQPQLDLRGVNWPESTLPEGTCGSSAPVTLRGGAADVTPPGGYRGFNSVQALLEQPVVYGDLFGNGGTEAAVNISCDTGGHTGQSDLGDMILVYAADSADHPRLLATLASTQQDAGNQATGAFHGVSIGQLAVSADERYYRPGDIGANPTGQIHEVWTWNGSRFGSPTSGPIGIPSPAGSPPASSDSPTDQQSG